MAKSDPDLRIPIEVWKKKLTPTALEVFLVFYNGELEQPTTFEHIKEYLNRSVSDLTIREALKTLIKHKCLVMRKVYLAGARKNLYQLRLKFRQRSNRIKYANAKLRQRFRQASVKSKSNDDIPIRNIEEESRVTSKKQKTKIIIANDSNGLQYSYLVDLQDSSNYPIISTASDRVKKFLTISSLRSNSFGITNERLSTKRSKRDLSSKKKEIPRAGTRTRVAASVPKDRLSRVEIARATIRDKSTSEKQVLSKDDKAREEKEFEQSYNMARAYETKLREYHRSPHLKFLKAFSLKYRGYQSFLKAAKQADALDMPYAQFIEAQFYYFHKWYSKAPSPYEICGGKGKMPAKSRAIGYLREELDIRNIHERITREGKIDNKRLTKSEVILYNQKLLEGMMSDGSTEEECLLEFAQPSMNFFDSAFLKQNTLYRQLRKQGKL